jgi:predicted nucleotidyltransferase component of viral defense system
VIAKGVITRRANEEHLSAQTVERDYILAHLCAEIGSIGEARLVFKGGTLLRPCYFSGCRYSADLAFSAIDGLSKNEALGIVATGSR